LTVLDSVVVKAAEMPAPAYYPPYPVFAGIAAVLCAIFAYSFIRGRRGPNRPSRPGLSLVFAVVLAVATGGLVVASYQEYVRMGTWTYFYELDVTPNATSAQALIVPIPEDGSLLAGLHLTSGEANWSFTDTVHGRGLYVQFRGPAALESIRTEFSPSGPNWNTKLTMTNSSVPSYGGPVWVFYTGGGGARLHLQPGGSVTNGRPALMAGWNLVYLFGIPTFA
jgi:hypothetical protein